MWAMGCVGARPSRLSHCLYRAHRALLPGCEVILIAHIVRSYAGLVAL